MVREDLIFINLDLKSQEEVFKFLAKEIVDKKLATDETQVYGALKKREAEGTTGMMDGFAIPHAKSEVIITPGIIVLKLNEGIEWDSLDGELTQYVIAMFIPLAESGSTHLKILSQVARMLMNEEFKESFISANSNKELANLIANKLEGEN